MLLAKKMAYRERGAGYREGQSGSEDRGKVAQRSSQAYLMHKSELEKLSFQLRFGLSAKT